MLKELSLAFLVSGALLGSGPAHGHPFTVRLEAEAGKISKKAETQTTALGAKPKTRDVLTLARGERVRIKWNLKNSDAKATFKDVIVHCFVVKEAKTGQREVPKLNKDVALETVNVMDFKPGESTEGELDFVLDRPGSYLLRLETVGAASADNLHEYFAALDLEVR